MFNFMSCEFHLINKIKKKELGIVLVGENQDPHNLSEPWFPCQ